MLTGLMGFAQGMAGVRTYNEARSFLGANAAMLGGLQSYAAQVPAYKPENQALYTNRFGLDLHAKATQDVSVSARLVMYKTFGAGDDDAVTNAGSAPYFADRVGVFDGTLGHVPPAATSTSTAPLPPGATSPTRTSGSRWAAARPPTAPPATCASTPRAPATAARPRCWSTTPSTA
jgi:hypothetical protein